MAAEAAKIPVGHTRTEIEPLKLEASEAYESPKQLLILIILQCSRY